MKYYNEHTIIFHDGNFKKPKDIRLEFLSQSLHYGNSVFEGLRSYKQDKGGFRIFKEKEHFLRLQHSALAMDLPLYFTLPELIEASYEVLQRNNLEEAYIRPLVYAPSNMSFTRNDCSHLLIAAWPMPPFFGEQLLRVMASSIQRLSPKSFAIQAKCSGHYVNSILATGEARENGFDEALLCDDKGHVAEGAGANVFYEKEGILYTPPEDHILAGITRGTILEICKEQGIPVKEQFFTVEELKRGDSAFFCGTAAEIIGWKSLDAYYFPLRWEASLGARIQRAYRQKVRNAGAPVSCSSLCFSQFIPAY
jgi:branched-chain amino acid aminotransferase